MYDPDEVQPIDEYVRERLKYAKEKYNLKIDLDKPTRGQRLEAALAMKDEDPWCSMEIMVGRRVDSSEELGRTLAMLQIAEALGPSDPRRFYAGFAHQYWPEEDK